MALTEQEEKTLIGLLAKMERPYPEKLFQAICAYTLTGSVEVVPVTRSGKVLMFRRPPTDPFFANQWHTPGTVQLPGDTVHDALGRIVGKEELGDIRHSAPEFLHYYEVKKGSRVGENPRGQERSLAFTVTVNEKDPGTGTFFPIENPTADTISHHKEGLLPMVRKRLFPAK